ncbi:MAG: sensor histidine kinase [Coprobacillaceae bacterium]
MNRRKKLTITSILLSLICIGIIVVFVYNLAFLSDGYSHAEKKYVNEIEQKIDVILYKSIDEIIIDLKELSKEYPMEIVLENHEKIIYQTIDVNFSTGYVDVLNEDAIALEMSGTFSVENSNYKIWYAIYHLSDSVYIHDFLSFYLIINIILFVVLGIILFAMQKVLISPLSQVKESLNKMDDYNFDLITNQDDDISQGLTNFARKLDQDLQTLAMQQTTLDSKLQQEHQNLQNALMISRGMVHDLKTPLYQTLHRNEDVANMSLREDIKEVVSYNVARTDYILKEINHTLEVLSNTEEFLSEEQEFDASQMIMEIIKSYQTRLQQRNLWVNMNIPETLIITMNKVCFYMLIQNIITNALQYSLENTEIEIEMDINENSLYLHCINESNEENIHRMKESETLLKTISNDNKYSSPFCDAWSI